MEKNISLSVNGSALTVLTHPQRPLLDVLREDLHLTGAKYGCGEGQCRACTVLLDGKSVPSCMTTIGDVENSTILTIEGLAKDNRLHPVQEAFMSEAAMQCGYCVPGMILSIVGFLNENPKATHNEVVSRLQKHLCRCCNYPSILKAVRRVTGPGEPRSQHHQ